MTRAGRRLILSADHLATLRRHAEAMSPEECCGVLLGKLSQDQSTVETVIVEAVVVGDNVAEDRRRRYDIDVPTLLSSHRQARESRREVVGYYHSHPASPARPSATDRQHALPETTYLILGLSDGRLVEARGWRLVEGGEDFEEEEMVLR